ncbi:hypothetical protein [Paracoccus seriniphilus]|uniref:Uncharacterized protein n=1 Tax=Paracoccus seriniphilus TaxID=184748 RepID=A0A239Q2K6_9RHOB|nr:hypothetical protein [Paracoccus seriniphilus]WCR13232.1 hypothetical protein JHW44_09790 [Paracoccus seriniphilus]SNT76725.1 hypothetical protein SAMN05444959_12532 [Paracoccus seriniphilus]
MTIIDRQAALQRHQDERARIEAILARAMPAEGCGPAIPVAPARGASRSVTPQAMVPDPRDKTGWKAESMGWRGFKAAVALDIFDRLAMNAARRKQPPPFTKGQVSIARLYRDLVERHDAGGMKLASLEGRMTSGSGTGRDFMDAYLAEGDAIRRLRASIGTGVAMQVRRVRPSARGGQGARPILDRHLVDAVCLHGKSLRQVLRDHRWSDDGKHAKALTSALRSCLDRMQGYHG